ncbi:MAG: gliding motility-associated ABC transporter substrate-binding protein GldG [Bacteroidales bacterium]|nr:gliding motility-associated ABC transporter substrate-binding protein GldG [Bacteroidales bacterium]MDD4209229.1 gliding motility-associated ABC transporter substrate-binding protein GldG [Bacteroidales bacterium]
MKESKNIRNIKKNNLIQFFAVLAIILLINIIFSFFFLRFDLTSEKRYTLSPSTVTLVENAEDIIYVKVYLYGKNLPPDFAELSQKTREFLDELRVYSKNIHYEFIDPSKGKDEKQLQAYYGQLYKQGLQPQPIQDVDVGGVNTRYIVPGAIITYRQRETPVFLLDSDEGILYNREEIIKFSIEKLEYNIGNAIRRLTNQQKASIAFIKGHGELTNAEVFSAAVGIADFYKVDSVILDNKISKIFNVEIVDSGVVDFKISTNKYDLLIVAKPRFPFSNYEKFLLDQFVMRGGKILWYVDPVFAEMDSLQNYMEVPCLAIDLNLEDLFFRYGVRLNTNLLQDLNALAIPVKTGELAGQAQYTFIPWYFFPLITPYADHPIVKNLNVLRTEFISSIDTVGTKEGLKKTVLLTTSATTKMINTPAIISLENLKRRANYREFSQKYIPVSVLVEGVFPSLYSGFNSMKDQEKIGFKEKSVPTKMIFVSDGDMIKNQFDSRKYPLPLGYDQYTDVAYGNKNFLLNAVNYLCEDEGIAQVRSKDFKMRLLDKDKLLKEKSFWQILNMTLPILCVLIMGIIFAIIRRRKFSR